MHKLTKKILGRRQDKDKDNDNDFSVDYHRAFRTVSTLLSEIQNRPLEIDDAKISAQDVHYELKVLNALATIMVTDSDVVAVAANYKGKESTANLIVMCNCLANIMPKSNTSYETLGRGFLSEFLVSFNPRSSRSTRITPPNGEPQIMETIRPTELRSDDPVELTKYLAEFQ